MARIQAYASNWTSSGSTHTIASGPGGVHSIIITTSSSAPLTVYLYDNTSGSGTILIAISVNSAAPFIWHAKDIAPLRFTTGLTVVNPSAVTTFVVTEQ